MRADEGELAKPYTPALLMPAAGRPPLPTLELLPGEDAGDFEGALLSCDSPIVPIAAYCLPGALGACFPEGKGLAVV